MVKLRATLAALLLAVLSCATTDEDGALLPATAERDPRLPQVAIEVAGHVRAVHAETFGDPSRPPLLFLHGSLGDFRAFRAFRALADDYYLIFWDQRGNGLSERITADEYDEASIVAEIDAIRERFAPGRKVSLIGHSFGGMYASLYASRRTANVDKLALLEPGGLTSKVFNSTFQDIIAIDLFDRGMNESLWQNQLVTPTTHELLDLRGLMVLQNGRQTRYYCDPANPPHYPVWRPGGYVEFLRSKLLGGEAGFSTPTFDFDFARGLDNFPQKVLLVGGTCSALGPEYQAKHHAPLFRAAEVVTVTDVGHRLFVEKPDEVVAIVRRYLDER